MKIKTVDLDTSRLLGFRLCPAPGNVDAAAAFGAKVGKTKGSPSLALPGAKIGGKVGTLKVTAA